MWDIYLGCLLHLRGVVLSEPNPGCGSIDLNQCHSWKIANLGYLGHIGVLFAISLRSSTERHGDFSESVVFHFFWVSCLFLGFVCCVWVLFGFCWCD